MGFQNIEIKARTDRPDELEDILLARGADFKGTDHQTDTYFKVPNGRLKLREGNIENNLIQYERSNEEGPKKSAVTLYKSQPGSNLKEALTKANGILVVVKKARKIFFINNVKFHIDLVDGLGNFVEIEVIDHSGSAPIDSLQETCNNYIKLLNIQQNDLVATSYSDLLMR